MSFLSNNTEYSIVTNAEVTQVIAHFSEEMILDILEKNLNTRASFMPKVNLVFSLEQDFRKSLQLYPAYSDMIQRKRSEIYHSIIQMICNYYGISSVETSSVDDLHAQATFLYSFFVSEFSNNIVLFFTNYIIREKNSIYELMEQDLSARSKDFNTTFSKKIYKNLNAKMIAIHANLDYVIDNICAFDIDFPTFVQNVLCDNVQVSNYLRLIVSEGNDNLFIRHIVPFVQQNKAMILTYIKLNLQTMAGTEAVDFVVK